MSDAIPPTYPVTVTLEETRKGILRSKTFWLQALTFLAVLVPPVQAWLASNPVDAIAALAALNVLVRFATSGRVTIFSANENAGSEAAGGPLSLLMVCTVAGASFGLALPSCSPSQRASLANVPITGSVFYRHAESGAKGGLSFQPGKPVQGFARVPVYDPNTGELVAYAELAVDLTSGK